jgi:hypothetical protein
MAKTSFARRSPETLTPAPAEDQKPAIPAEAELIDNTPEAPAPEPKKTLTKSVAKPAPVENPPKGELAKPGGFGGIEGDIDPDDIRLPRINVVQSTSAIADEFQSGAIVLDKEIEIGNDEHPVELVVLWGKKLYQQKLPFGESEESPLVFATRAEVREFGGTTEYSKEAISEGRYFEDLAHFILALEFTAEQAEELGRCEFEFNGKHYLRAAFTVNGSGYNSFAKPIITSAAAGAVYGRRWLLKTEKRSNARGRWFVPMPRLKARITDPAELEFLASLIPGNVQG